MDTRRRVVLRGSLGVMAAAMAVGAGVLTPRAVLAAWPEAAFGAKNMDASLKELFGANAITESDAVTIKVPDIAENGAVVPVAVSSKLAGIQSVSILVEGNPTPLAASFKLSNGAGGNVSTRVKVGKTSNVVAVVNAGGKLYSARRQVKVTVGGCGG